MKSEYSKGEWEITSVGGVISPHGHNITADNGEFIGRIRTEANARLIAQAPKLVEVCKEAVDCWRELGKIIFAKGQTSLFDEMPAKFKGDNNPFYKIDEAIASVEGK